MRVDMEQCGIVGVRNTNTRLPETCMSSGLTTLSCSSETGCSGSVMERRRSSAQSVPFRPALGERKGRTKNLLGVNLFPLFLLPL